MYIHNFELQYLKTYNPKKYWKILNANCTHKDCKVDLSNFYSFCEKWCNTTVEVESEYVLSEKELNTLACLKLNDSINHPITHDEITKCINTLKTNKSSGCDNVVNEYIKSTVNTMLNFYVILFNKIFDSGVIPSQWTFGNIIPLYKKKKETPPILKIIDLSH